MSIVTAMVVAVCVVANAAAIFFFVRGRRSSAAGRYIVQSLVAGGLTLGAGLLGTVLGLRLAFGAVASVDASRKATLLARGISEAMNATAFGLVATVVPFAVALVLFLRRPRKDAP